MSDSATVGLTGLQHQACGNGRVKAAGFSLSSTATCVLAVANTQSRKEQQTLPFLDARFRTALEK